MRALTAALGALAFLASAPATAGFSELSDEEVAARVQQVVDRAMSRPEAVGLSIAVANDDRVIVDRGAGKADLEWDAPADETAVFRIGSVTKQFTAAAIMKLVEQGKLSLDDPLAKFVPEFDSGGRTITIRQLLNHTSGIPNYTAQAGFFAKSAPLDLGHEDLLAVVKDVDFDFEPGKGWNYSNTGYYLLGVVVEKASGTRYDYFVRDELLKPLGLARTYYGWERLVIPHRAQGYSFNPADGSIANDANISMTTPGAAGALASTAGDLLRWQIALTAGKAVSPASYQQMVTATVPTNQGGARYGFGLMVGGEGAERRISHTGGINGFNSVLTYLPGKHLRTAVISNSEGLSSEAVEGLLISALTSETSLPPARAAAAPQSEPALRRLIAGLAAGDPDYDTLTASMAQLTRAQLPQLTSIFNTLGAIETVDFKGVGLDGSDTFLVKFAKGSLDFSIMVDAEGKVALAGFRPVGPLPTP